FVLKAEERPEPLDAVLDALERHWESNDHFEFYYFPYGRNALTKRNNRLMAGAEPAPLGPVRRFYEYEVMENLALGTLAKIGRRIPPLVRPFGRLSSVALSARSYSDISHRVFVTHRRVHFVESEFAVPREALRDVLAELRAGIAKLADPIMLPVEVRFAAPDDIWLSTAYDRESAYVAIHQYVGMPFRAYFDLFESIAGAVGGRPHWGKMHTADAETLRTRYPRFDDFARVRAEVDPEGRFSNPYIDRVLGPAAGSAG
ncbi:MAG TPA: D-arabinono-1,4-lactone oxidase, partial [Micromonosporaceae bacterium]|nr:D-arabinono-1,4-lactone oxidase [Micromonosporaceae bacterium]